MDMDKIKKIIDIIRGMTSAELAVLIVVVVSAVGSSLYVYDWVEGRYAKVVDMQTKLDQQLHIINEQQKEINQQQAKLRSVRENIIAVINSLPPDQRREFEERVRASAIFDKDFTPDPSKFIQPR